MTEVLEETFTSHLVAAPKVKRTPADFLLERQAVMIRFTRTAERDVPTIEQLTKHAERFGSECVAETAAELGYGLESLTRLIEACDRADLALLRQHRATAKLDKRRPADKRARALLGIEEDEDAAGE